MLHLISIKVLVVIAAAFIIACEYASIVVIVPVFLVPELLHPLDLVLVKHTIAVNPLLEDILLLLFLLFILLEDDSVILRSPTDHVWLL
jgi:hypothetical protein